MNIAFKEKNTIEKVAMGAKPDPFNFVIKAIELYKTNTIILANYGGATFGGDKLMLLKGNWFDYDFKSLDPHFLDEEYAVKARFAPNHKGWEMARLCAEVL